MIKSVMVDGAEALKMMVDGKLAWERGGLPAGYRRCKYLQSTGKQYLVTNYYPTEEDIITVKFNAISGTGAFIYNSKCGAWNASPNYWLALKITTFSYLEVWAFYSYIPVVRGITFDGQDILSVLDLHNKTSTITIGDDTYTKIIEVGTHNENQPPLALFYNNLTAKIYSFEVVRNGSIIANFIPSVDQSGVPCMYDTVSKQTFFNQGTGEFLYELA